MAITKSAKLINNFIIHDFYYESAREGMFDLISNLVNENMIRTIFVPGYIGWSPNEGSGIFDPINSIEDLNIIYYKMDVNLNIKLDDLKNKIQKSGNQDFAVLVVNYFGFKDPKINTLYEFIKLNNGLIIEDNAHGFFTHMYSSNTFPDATFFSLHKMLPFDKGGSLRIINNNLLKLRLVGKSVINSSYNPWLYDVIGISKVRKQNYMKLDILVKQDKYYSLFEPLKEFIADDEIPQTYPIRIKIGNRDRIYDLMNKSGFGVVSLYHTLIEPLQNMENGEALSLSKKILNLPVHQDVDSEQYIVMIEYLAKLCEELKWKDYEGKVEL